MEPARLFRNALLVTQDAQRRIFRGDLRVEGNRIVSVGEHLREEGAEVVPCDQFAVIPGFVNAHTHVAMSILRAIADDLDLPGFLAVLFALDAHRTDADLEAGAAAGIAEMLLSGTTTFLDLYYGEDAIGRAVERLGIRAYLGWAVLDPEFTTQKGVPVENARHFMERWRGRPRVQPLPAPQGVYVCGEETWLKTRDLAQEFGTFSHYHLSETRREVHEHEKKTGLRPPLWLDAIGFFSGPSVAAHAVWLTRREIQLLADHRIGIVHCPSSNLKLATGGVAPVVELREAGAQVGLGTDSAASNNSLSILREMHTAGLLQKHHRWDAGALPAQTLLDLATIEGARVIGQGHELGSLEPGKLADFSLLRLDHPTIVPMRTETIVAQLAYSASEEAIDSVYVDGECVVRHRALVREEWSKIGAAAEAAANSLWAYRPH